MSANDRDYDIKDVKVDERFLIAKREMLITFAVQVAYTIVMLVVGYSLGKGDPRNYTFIAGMPAWWFWALVITAGFLVVVYYLVRRVFKDMSVEPWVK